MLLLLILENVIWLTATNLKSKNCLNIIWNYTVTHYTNLAMKQQNVNIKNYSLSLVLTATDQKPQKSLNR